MYKPHIQQIISIWLIVSALLVLLMIVLGGITRLTNSGLSIVEWNPVFGVIPPISFEDWNNEFNKYKSSPEFNLVNNQMTISEFKFIFFIEYIHRLIGRVTGIIIIIPFLTFYYLQYLTKQQCYRLLFIIYLVVVQGFMGWYMVKSGLKDNPYVSHYRLAGHFLLAVIIYHQLIIEILNIIQPFKSSISTSAINKIISVNESNLKAKLAFFNKIIILLLYVQVMFGALVAGLDAGLIYNEFPNMGNGLIPIELLNQPMDFTVFDNSVVIQFIHRWFGILIGSLIICYATLLVILNRQIPSIIGVIAIFLILVQITTGIITLVYHVPTLIALIHQVCAILLLTIFFLIQNISANSTV
ncbi:hypothetical protein OCHUTO_0149 [Orientia chuto str. Dubai]|uniref:Heme A synthase n=1 Tax=Orientia chuto str. Dubai TaxID=1359168 RepID=A0A0F3MNE0_9RICK|nr:COX15/CtaA family protein [Candidatus Orientia mediorientalis]KJV57255.1 hypothetical protein OCHUTO_0149 [Orientia chuto str. Dubai]